jgi:ArsR family transcriptional regulator, arsenate/arsenite/antimonite-responsive transcriptional repressor / arsenate reductase (thioredoxin)
MAACRAQYFCYSGNVETTEAAAALAALARETRLDLLRLLMSEGANGMPAGDIRARLGVPASTLSFHLAALEHAGLTRSTRQGRQIIHAVRIDGLRRLLGFLTETCCGGRPELCGDLARLLPAPPNEDSGMTPAFNVLFLCSHNAARSIIAEAILREIGGTRFQAYSAGTEPAAAPNPEVMEKLRALGHDTGGLHSKSWLAFTGPDAPRMDFVITLCDTADEGACPDFGDLAVTAAWPLPDPARFTGGAVERASMLNMLYAALRRRLEIFTALPFASLDRMAMTARLEQIAGGGTSAAAGGV